MITFDKDTIRKLRVNIRRKAIGDFSKNMNQLLNFYDAEKLKEIYENLFSKQIFGEQVDEEFTRTITDIMIYFSCKGTSHSIPVNTFNLCRMIEKSGHSIWEGASPHHPSEEGEEEGEEGREEGREES